VAVVLAARPDGKSATPAAASDEDGPMVFQASGWVEPDPMPVMVTAMVDGVVDSVRVREGQLVRKGDVVATLVDEDARLALELAKSGHRKLQAERSAHLGAIEGVRGHMAAADARVNAAAAACAEAEDQSKRLSRLPEKSVSESDVVSAGLRLQRERALKAAAEAERTEIAADLGRMQIETQVKDEGIAVAAVEVRQAELALSRTAITVPVDGRVLRLLAAPGQKKMLQMDAPDSSTVAVIYDPKHLQVRVDVPLADAAGLSPGQKVRIRCGLFPDRVFHGEVTRINGEADVQRNSLQAKVRILDPTDELRPEMLCRAEFLALSSTEGGSVSPTAGGISVWVPQSALSGSSVWVCDPDRKRVQRKEVKILNDVRDGYRRVADGLRPGEWVVMNPENLHDGGRVKPEPVKFQ
jgi:multidrug efflux pump subunit AcrA (membrane-fusion protein)